MAQPTSHPEMAQQSRWRATTTTTTTTSQQICSSDDLISTLIAAAALHRYTPAAPSPLNPRSSADAKPRKHTPRSRRLRPVRRQSAETPTERLLRRKAALAYERTTQGSPLPPPSQPQQPWSPRGGGAPVIVARLNEFSEKGPSVTITTREASPAGFKESGPVVVNLWEFLTDMERQSAVPLSGTRERRPAPRQRLEVMMILVLLSACLTLLTVVGLDSFRNHYLGG